MTAIQETNKDSEFDYYFAGGFYYNYHPEIFDFL